MLLSDAVTVQWPNWGDLVLVDAREANPEAFERAEDQLVQAARIHSVGDLHRVASFWRQQVIPASRAKGTSSAVSIA